MGEANMSEDSVVSVECSATLLTFSRCNATTWTTRTTTWTTIKLSKSSLQLKLFHHNLRLQSTYSLVLASVPRVICSRHTCYSNTKCSRVQSFYVTMCLLEKKTVKLPRSGALLP